MGNHISSHVRHIHIPHIHIPHVHIPHVHIPHVHVPHRKKKNHHASIKQSYRFIDGRKYFNKNRDVIYPLPVDDEECDRSQLQHFLFHHIWDGNFSSPVKQILERGGKVLDIGCGPGAWLMEMATGYERTQFVGIDLIPMFPTEIKPHNLKFQQHDVLKGLPFDDDEFDLVCIQNSSICFTEDQWKEIVIPEMVRVTKPNGWVEIMEIEPNIQNLPKNFEPLCDAYIKYGKSNNINLEIVPNLGNILRERSLGQMTDFHEESRKLLHYEEIDPEDVTYTIDMSEPQINMAGKLSKENIMSFYHTISPIILPILGITQNEYNEIVDTVNINFEKSRSYNNLYRFYARKR